jgi:hypothetical protein
VARADCKDFNWVGIRKETGHVKIMDRHVSKDAATLDVLKWWRDGSREHSLIYVLGMCQQKAHSDNIIPPFPTSPTMIVSPTSLELTAFLSTFEVLIEATLKTNHELDTSGIASIDGLHSFWQVGSNGLFAKDVLTVCSSSLDLFGMVLGRGANPDSIYLRVGNDIHGIVSELGDIELLGS